MTHLFLRDDGTVLTSGTYDSDNRALAEARSLAAQYGFRVQTARVVETDHEDDYTYPDDAKRN
ncbi:hypothetical protein BSZ35_19090 [Salinibacter sp. 10B]|uniref:hypothetical protein n=1 Tax=Salinibacter sp. 10B TaxID=1923971 RepID=UPI000CF5521C|nr:hypothetical protein [Salinibacter sp. 10B]PQJ26755.1 hypothetical protein BSZ35_19090 [Salinibacter sp. 10B]